MPRRASPGCLCRWMGAGRRNSVARGVALCCPRWSTGCCPPGGHPFAGLPPAHRRQCRFTESLSAVFKGIVASVLASVLFGAIYYLSPFLAPLGGEEIFGWRVLCTLPFTTALLLWRGEGAQVRALWQRVRARPALAPALLLSSAMLGGRLWLFMWVLYRERLSTAHRWATGLALVGVGFELVRAGGVSWETALVALGYPVYFALRRRLRTEQLAGHWLDMALMLPVALWFVLREPSSLPLVAGHAKLWVLVPLLGVVSAVALALYMAASRLLPMGLFGLLTYVEPVLLVLVALVLGESVAPGQQPLYGLVFAAVAVLVADGAAQVLRERRAGRSERISV